MAFKYDWRDELKEIMGYEEPTLDYVSYDWKPYIEMVAFIERVLEQHKRASSGGSLPNNQ